MRLDVLKSKVLSVDEIEGTLLLNGKIALRFYRFKDGEASGLTVYDDEELIDELGEVDGILAEDIIEEALILIDKLF
jgi:hypothetical protein